MAEQRHIHEIFIWLKNGNSPQNEDKFEYYPDLKNEDYLKNWDIPQNDNNLKMTMTSKMKMISNNEYDLKN